MKRLRLLVIDDEPALAEFVAQVASECGFDAALTADDGAFRESFRDERPDVIVLDLGMPGMDGVELLRFLADEDNRAPVLIFSGFDRRVLESAFRLGQALGQEMVGPLEKPVRYQQLHDLLAGLKAKLVQ
ncbi:MAG TPA: response regulator [Sphingomicrobium sp.]|nr:response regulator [Sphingomicrobium sp.]